MSEAEGKQSWAVEGTGVESEGSAGVVIEQKRATGISEDATVGKGRVCKGAELRDQHHHV